MLLQLAAGDAYEPSCLACTIAVPHRKSDATHTSVRLWVEGEWLAEVSIVADDKESK
jgi:hypothetical protein